jgi:hypothetical protein
MKDLLYNRHDNSFTFMADGWHLGNLSTNRNGFNFCALPEEVFINSDLPRVRLLAYAYTTRLDSLLSNSKLLRQQSKLGIFR